jgi:hypothetical protein
VRLEALAAVPEVDAILVADRGIIRRSNKPYAEGMIKARRESGKPFVGIFSKNPGTDT